MILFPNAKINIGLNIVAKRDDGYHDIETLFYPVPWYDVLEVQEGEDFSFEALGLEIPNNVDENICASAYHLLKKDFDLPPVNILLYKNIPIGAGLGGGSADGTFMLTLLNDHFQLALSEEQVTNYAHRLGSDCPFFVKNEALLATGRGDILEQVPLDLSDLTLVIVYPNIVSDTAQAYQCVVPKAPVKVLKDLVTSPITTWKENIQNDFEVILFDTYPELAQIKEELYGMGAIYASLSGSGSAIYGYFQEPVSISMVQSKITQKEVRVFTTRGEL